MKNTLKYLSPLLLTSALTLSVIGDDTKKPVSSRDPVPPPYDHQTPVKTDRVEVLGPTGKISAVIGLNVLNKSGEKIGQIEDVMIDLNSGRVVSYIVSSGGFLGINEELSAVPPKAFHIDLEKKEAHLDMTKEQLAAAPHFKSNEWPVHDEAYLRRTYTAYGFQPYFDTDEVPAADNTARNSREAQLTPLDQGTSETDVAITRNIRKELVEDKSLSVNAHNVKIITMNGEVTLRGPVETEAERRAVEAIAKRYAVNQKVNNQLEAESTVNR